MKKFGALSVRTVISVALVSIAAAVAFYLGASVTDTGLYVLEACIGCLVIDLLTVWWIKLRYFGALCDVVEQVLAVHSS